MLEYRQRGFTLIEVVVAMFVLAIVFSGAAATVIAVLGAAQINETRAVGSNIAQAQIELLRARPYTELESLLGTTVAETTSTDGHRYGVEMTLAYASLDEDVSACAVDPAQVGQQVIQVDLAVWPGHEPTRRSTSTTMIARQPDELPPGKGHLAVYVTDEQEPPQPVADASVTLLQNGTNLPVGPERATNAAGCVLFPNVDEANYDIRVVLANHVGPRPSPDEAAPIRPGSVVAGTTSIVEFRYARAGRFEPINVIAPAADDAILPDEPLAVTVSRMGRSKLGQVGNDQSIAPVWPGDWQAWAGSCPDADPEGLTETGGLSRWPGASRQPRITAAPVVLTPLVVHVGALELQDGGGGGPAVFTGVTTITAQAVDAAGAPSCADGQGLLTFDSFTPALDGYDAQPGPLRIGLPYGVWELTIESIPSQGEGQGTTTTRQITVEVSPPTAEPQLLVVEVPR